MVSLDPHFSFLPCDANAAARRNDDDVLRGHQGMGGGEQGSPEEAKIVRLYAQMPPISKLDNKLNDLKNCVHLSLSTNCIDRFNTALALPKLRILSMGRNNLKKIEKLEGCAGTLEELWLSYNQISNLDGVDSLSKLTTLYMSNNKLSSWDELSKLAGLAELRDILLVGTFALQAYSTTPSQNYGVHVRLSNSCDTICATSIEGPSFSAFPLRFYLSLRFHRVTYASHLSPVPPLSTPRITLCITATTTLHQKPVLRWTQPRAAAHRGVEENLWQKLMG